MRRRRRWANVEYSQTQLSRENNDWQPLFVGKLSIQTVAFYSTSASALLFLNRFLSHGSSFKSTVQLHIDNNLD